MAFPDTKGGAQIRAIGQAALKIIENQPGIAGNPHIFPSEVGRGPFTAASACLQRVARLAASVCNLVSRADTVADGVPNRQRQHQAEVYADAAES